MTRMPVGDRHRRLARARTRARARAAERGWRLVVDARGAGCARARGRRASRASSRSRATSPTPEHRRALVEAAGDRIDLLVNNASVLGPSPQPALADYPLAELARVYDVNVLAPLALVQVLFRGSHPGAAHPQRHLGRSGRAVRGLGRLRLVEGRPRAADGDPRGRAAAAARLRVDPGDMRTQTYQQAFPGEDISDLPLPEESVPGLLALIEGSLPSGRYRARELVGVSGVSALERPVRLEAHEPPEVRGQGRDDVALLVATRHDLALVHARFRDLPRVPRPRATCSSSTSPRRCAAALEARLGERRLQLWLSTPAPDGTWVVELRDERPSAATRGRPWVLALDLPGGAHAELARALRRQRPTRRRALRARRAARGLPSPPRAADPVRLRPRAVAARRLPDRLRARARERRDAERRPAVHGGARDGARRARSTHRTRHPAHGRLLARARRAALPRALPRAGRDRAARQRRPRLGRPRDRGRARRSCARSRRWPPRTARCRTGRAGRISS